MQGGGRYSKGQGWTHPLPCRTASLRSSSVIFDLVNGPHGAFYVLYPHETLMKGEVVSHSVLKSSSRKKNTFNCKHVYTTVPALLHFLSRFTRSIQLVQNEKCPVLVGYFCTKLVRVCLTEHSQLETESWSVVILETKKPPTQLFSLLWKMSK